MRGGACEEKVRDHEGRDRQHVRRVSSLIRIAADTAATTALALLVAKKPRRRMFI